MEKGKEYATKAAAMWVAMTANEKAMVRFGMFPADAMRAAQVEGFTDGRCLAVALMDCAKADGGMRA